MENEESMFIGSDDFKFYQTLHNDEKILCVFDVWVMQDGECNNIDGIKQIIDLSIQSMEMANVVMTNNLLIINAENYKLVRTAAELFFNDGFILERLMLTDSSYEVFRRQKYCNVYSILGVTEPVSLN